MFGRRKREKEEAGIEAWLESLHSLDKHICRVDELQLKGVENWTEDDHRYIDKSMGFISLPVLPLEVLDNATARD